MPRPMRRVVTGHNAQGKSVILSDAASPHVLELPGMPGLAFVDLWATDGAPASNAGQADAAARTIVLEPPARGTNHAWSNRTDAPCRVAFILVSADPL